MYIRNEDSNQPLRTHEVQTVQDIDAMLGVPSIIKWLFKCAHQVLTKHGRDPNDALGRATICSHMKVMIEDCPRVLDYTIVCDERNNPPSVLDAGALVFSVKLLIDGDFGQAVYSFSNQEFTC